jgi:glycosyltransferase involved in cell wall biosynthesis
MHILDSLNRGGAETLALDVCRNARAGGLELVFVATGGGDLEDDFRESGVEFVRLRRESPVDLNLASKLGELIRARGVRVVHSHQAVEALHAYLATRGTEVKNVLSFHLCTSDAKNRLALRFLAPRADACVAVSRDLLACLKSEGGFRTDRNFHVVYNGVDAQRLKPTGASLRDELSVGADELLLGMVGNFYADARKDQLTVCRALHAFFRAVPAARFAFVGGQSQSGPGAFEECVEFCREQGIAERVHFLGRRADVADVLASLDLFVFSTRRDSFGVAVVEALMLGVPSVVSDIGALLEVSGGGQYAETFRAGDAGDLARVLVGLAADATGRALLGARGREWAARQFGIAAHIRSLRRLYESL